MKEKVSIMIILLVTLLIGIAIGWFIPRPAAWYGPGTQPGVNTPGMRGAGGGMGPGMQGGMPMHQRVVNQLNLSPEQRQQFFEIIRNHRNDMQTMMQRRRSRLQPQVDSLFDAMNADMQNILTPEQYKMWQQWSQQRMHQLGGPAPGSGMGPGGRRGNQP